MIQPLECDGGQGAHSGILRGFLNSPVLVHILLIILFQKPGTQMLFPAVPMGTLDAPLELQVSGAHSWAEAPGENNLFDKLTGGPWFPFFQSQNTVKSLNWWSFLL